MMHEDNLRESFKFRKPQLNDGKLIHDLVSRSPPLDLNSLYSYLLICAHFNGTSVVCETEDDIVGYVSGYLHPHKEETLFIWQVAVLDEMRGHGLAKEMIMDILTRRELQGVKFIESTVTLDNTSSKALFYGLASHLKTGYRESAFFPKDLFGKSGHAAEWMVRIGPFSLKII